MGMEYDGTPEKSWIGAKVYAEYAIMLVNSYIDRERSNDIPQAIVQSVKNNIERAAAQLPKEFKREPHWGIELEKFRPLYKSVFTPPESKSGFYEGSVPASELSKVFAHVRNLFAVAYAASRFNAKKEMALYSCQVTEKGIYESWDWKNYCKPEDDPQAKPVSMEAFEESVWIELVGDGMFYWRTNETHIFSRLCLSGPYAGHVSGGSPHGDKVSVETPTAIRELNGCTRGASA